MCTTTAPVAPSVEDPAKRAGSLRQRHGLIVKGKRISCPPHHDYEHGFPLIRSLRASGQRSTSVLFSFVLSLLIVARSFAVRQSKTLLALPILEIALVFVRLDQFTCLIVNSDHSGVRLGPTRHSGRWKLLSA